MYFPSTLPPYGIDLRIFLCWFGPLSKIWKNLWAKASKKFLKKVSMRYGSIPGPEISGSSEMLSKMP